MAAWWTVVQACIWIATRDERLIQKVGVHDTLLVADELTPSVTSDLNWELSEASTSASSTPFEARDTLTQACSVGSLKMIGRLRGEGDLVEISAEAWANLELRDQSRKGVIAASPDTIDRMANWWDELRVWSLHVQRQWPFPRRRRSGSRLSSMEFRPDTVAETAQAQRRQRQFRNQKPRQLDLTLYGLPDVVDVTLVEAWSWCAFGVAVPRWAWAADVDLANADEEYAQSRIILANSLWEFRRVKVSAGLKPLERPPTDMVRIEYEVTLEHGNDALKRHHAAKEKLANAVSVIRLVEDVYQRARAANNVSDADPDFVQRKANQAERDLFKAFLRGELECLGRRSVDSPLYEVLPKDYFRLPICIRTNHNILESTDQSTVEDHRLITEHVSKWTDLRVNTESLRLWRNPLANLTKGDAPIRSVGRKPKWDWEGMLVEIVKLATRKSGLPNVHADLERHAANWFMSQTGDQPAESEIRLRISRIYKAIEGRK